jgi:LysR family transcriptional regulator, regulator of gene expression of beta-lactamase
VMASAAAAGAGVALLPARMFEAEITAGRLARPFATEVDAGRYWLTRLRSRVESAAMRAFGDWLVRAAAF